ncbi:Fc.00g045250.m01.CDS01 [Cosmosporella sp. VM-42]
MSVCASPGFDSYQCNFAIANFTNSSKNSNSLDLLSFVEPDPDIAGLGIFWPFALAATISAVVALIIGAFELCEIIYDHKRHSATGWWRALDQFLVGWSDQQIALGIATCAAALTFKCDISNYHMNLITQWLVLSMVTHTNALLVHCGYVSRQYRHVGFIRLFFVIGFIVLVIFVQVLARGTRFYPDVGNLSPLQILPVPCFYVNATVPPVLKSVPGWGDSTATSGSLFIIATIIAFLAWTSVLLHLCMPRRCLISWGARATLWLVNFVLAIIAIKITWDLRSWVHTSGFMESEATTGENDESTWSYGQMIPVVITALVIFNLAEGFAETVDEDDDEN